MEIKIPVELPDNFIDRVVERLKEDDDYIPVVMCKDCKHLGIKDMGYGYCKARMTGIVKPDDYCSYGEFKED